MSHKWQVSMIIRPVDKIMNKHNVIPVCTDSNYKSQDMLILCVLVLLFANTSGINMIINHMQCYIDRVFIITGYGFNS